nr:diguanylate cyclase [Thiorhodococcus mannitoliphagus]
MCHVGVSMGIAVFPDDADDMDTLIRRADNAMYEVKRRWQEQRSHL